MFCDRCSSDMETVFEGAVQSDYWCTTCNMSCTVEWLGSECKEIWSDHRVRRN